MKGFKEQDISKGLPLCQQLHEKNHVNFKKKKNKFPQGKIGVDLRSSPVVDSITK